MPDSRSSHRRRHPRPSARAVCERLGRRLMLCVPGTAGYYKGSAPAFLTGTEGPDNITINVEGGCSSDGGEHWVWDVKYRLNNGPSVDLLTEDYGTINLSTLGGDDTVVVSGLRDHNLSVDLGLGNDTLTVNYDYATANFDGPAYGIWRPSLISVQGGIGYDTINYNALRVVSPNPNYVEGYVFDSNTYTFPGTRLATGFQRPGETFFADTDPMEFSGVENARLITSPVTTIPTIVNVDSLIGTTATVTVMAAAPVTVNVAAFVGGDVTATGGAGADIFNIGTQTNGARSYIDGAGGTNTLNFTGTNGPDAFTVLSNGLITGQTVASYTNIQSLAIDGGLGADTILLDGAPALPYSVRGGADNDVITVTPNVVTLPPIDGGAGANTLVLDHHNLVGNPVAYTFQANGLQYAGARSGFVSKTNLAKIRVDAGSGDDTFLFASSFTYFAEAHGGYGNDRFTIGGGNLALAAANAMLLTGDQDSDTLQLDDRFSSTNSAWTVSGSTVTLGTNSFSVAGFDAVELFGNATASTFTFSGALAAAFSVDAGDGSDTITLTTVYNSFPGVVYPLYFTGGGGTNDALVVNDAATLQSQYTLAEHRIQSLDLVTQSRGIDLTYFFFPNVTLQANNDATAVTVNGQSNDVTHQMTLRLGGGNDVVTLHPHDAAGNGHFASGMGIFGEAGTDKVIVDDTLDPNGVVYSVANLSAGTLNVSDSGLAFLGAFSDVETLSLLGSAGDDTVKVESIQSGNAFTFAGGLGNDSFEVVPTSKNLTTSITNTPLVAFDGGPGTDTIKLFNQSNTSAWTYTRAGGILSASRVAPTSYFVQFTLSTNEEADVYAGAAGDQYFVKDSAPGYVNIFDSGGGADLAFIGGPAIAGRDAGGDAAGDVLANIRGPVLIFGDSTDSATLEDSGDAVGRVVHVDQSNVGSAAGDSLFGAGGRVYFGGIGTLTLNLGTGADAVYSQISTATNLKFNANGPSGAAGDALYLALAGTSSYTITPGAPGAGTVASPGRKPVNYTGIDQQVQVDNIAPQALSGTYLFNAAVPGVLVNFSENVTSGLLTYSFELDNLTTNESITFDGRHLDFSGNSAVLSFPGLPGGVLPDGEYHLTLSSNSFSDAFGNYSATDFGADFFVLAGDANHDHLVGFQDLVVLAQNYNQTGRDFSHGNFDYSTDGTVDFNDLVILAQRYNLALSQLAALLAPPTAVTTKTRISRNEGGEIPLI